MGRAGRDGDSAVPFFNIEKFIKYALYSFSPLLAHSVEGVFKFRLDGVGGEDLAGEEGGVGATVDGNARDGDTARHLHDAQEGVDAAQLAASSGYADDGARREARDNAGQVGGHTRDAYEHTAAGVLGFGDDALQPYRVAVRGAYMLGLRYAELGKDFHGSQDDFIIRLAS